MSQSVTNGRNKNVSPTLGSDICFTFDIEYWFRHTKLLVGYNKYTGKKKVYKTNTLTYKTVKYVNR